MNKWIKYVATIGTIVMTVAMSGQRAAAQDIAIVDGQIVIEGYEWGPRVNRVILELDGEVNGIHADDATVETAGQHRYVIDAYLSDGEGNESEGESSNFVTVELELQLTADNPTIDASPFVTAEALIGQAAWVDDYIVSVSGITVNQAEASIALADFRANLIDNRLTLDSDLFNVRDSFTGEYTNPLTQEDEEITLQYAAYEPETLKELEKAPLMIFLHGAGEGGPLIESMLLGNKVTNLAKPQIQNYFNTNDTKGTFILSVQSPTVWMDEGDGTNGKGAGRSRYTEILMDTIEQYVANNGHVDPNRIYIGGLSNGGYMTLNMLIEYPDYFAGAFAIAEAYAYYEYARNEDGTYQVEGDTQLSSRWLTDEKVQQLKDVPIWFIHAASDPVVTPNKYVLPTYRKLLEAGAENVWFSYYKTVRGLDASQNEYFGHGSWIYFFNDQVRGVQDNEAIRNGEEFAPSDSDLGGLNELNGTVKHI